MTTSNRVGQTNGPSGNEPYSYQPSSSWNYFHHDCKKEPLSRGINYKLNRNRLCAEQNNNYY